MESSNAISISQVSYLSMVGFYHFGAVCSSAIVLDDFRQLALRWSSESRETMSGIIEISEGNQMNLRLASNSCDLTSSILLLLTCCTSWDVNMTGFALFFRLLIAFFNTSFFMFKSFKCVCDIMVKSLRHVIAVISDWLFSVWLLVEVKLSIITSNSCSSSPLSVFSWWSSILRSVMGSSSNESYS